MIKKNAREIAAEVLFAITENNSYAENILNDILIKSKVTILDISLATRICYGVLQNTILCDFYIDHFAKNKKITHRIRTILRIGLYQLIFMDRVPQSAAVNTSVDLVYKFADKRATGFVNGILREISRNLEKMPEIPTQDFKKYLSIKYSHPEPLVGLLIKEFGQDIAQDFIKSNNEISPITIRVNTIKSNINEVLTYFDNAEIVYENTFTQKTLPAISRMDIFKDGKVYIQDIASQMAIYALNPKADSTMIDVCSAPGGKSFLSAMFMKNTGKIFSCDIYEKKISAIEENAKKLGINIINPTICDATIFNPSFEKIADYVLCDVPCSGLGIIRKKPEIRYKNIDDIKSLPQIQLEILTNSAKYLKSGGTLVYSTCTILSRENSKVIDAFLQENCDFYVENFDLPLNGMKNINKLTLMPNIHETDGFFIAKLRRK